jgi:glucose/arabinose dehydrogenase
VAFSFEREEDLQMIRRIVLTTVLALAVMQPVNAYQFEDGSVEVAFATKSISAALTGGGNVRGPALAVMKDDTVLLGGGRTGGEIFTFNKDAKSLRKLGSFIPASRRIIDSRFAINDIAILSESATSAKLLISYPRLGIDRSCVEVAIDELSYDRKKQKVKFVSNWFVTQPCVPISAVQHTAGRFEVIDQNTVYVTIGDLGYSLINDRSKRGDLGSIFRLTAKSASKISQGHRNPQGIVMYNKVHLLAAEHGPRGGDELNLIKKGSDYGWPFVSYGEPYSDGDYVRPEKTATHVGYVEPLTYWVPSIAPTELVQLPQQGWGNWNGALVLGTLREEVLVFMKLNQGLQVVEKIQVKVGHRVRDLELLRNGSLLMSTDSGQLITAANVRP